MTDKQFEQVMRELDELFVGTGSNDDDFIISSRTLKSAQLLASRLRWAAPPTCMGRMGQIQLEWTGDNHGQYDCVTITISAKGRFSYEIVTRGGVRPDTPDVCDIPQVLERAIREISA